MMLVADVEELMSCRRLGMVSSFEDLVVEVQPHQRLSKDGRLTPL